MEAEAKYRFNKYYTPQQQPQKQQQQQQPPSKPQTPSQQQQEIQQHLSQLQAAMNTINANATNKRRQPGNGQNYSHNQHQYGQNNMKPLKQYETQSKNAPYNKWESSPLRPVNQSQAQPKPQPSRQPYNAQPIDYRIKQQTGINIAAPSLPAI